MLTLITGVPGSGKTLYAIAELLLPLLGKSLTFAPENEAEQTAPYRIYANIRGLQIDFDLVEPGPVWESAGKGEWTQSPGHRLGLHNWHQWAKPGAVLVADEFQKIWPQRPNGSPVPPDVSAMDTHRHKGVDFVLITQKFNFDGHIRGLVGRHLHVRRIGNTPLAIVYEWDACSHTLQFSKSLSKRPWRFPKKVYALYHSADAHTKQPRKLPALVFVILAAFGLAAWFVPSAYSRIAGKGEEHQLRMANHLPGASASKPGASAPAPGAPIGAPATLYPTPGGFPTAPAAAVAAPALAGCVLSVKSQRCACFDTAGQPFQTDIRSCMERIPTGGTPLALGQDLGVPVRVRAPEEPGSAAYVDAATMPFPKTGIRINGTSF